MSKLPSKAKKIKDKKTNDVDKMIPDIIQCDAPNAKLQHKMRELKNKYRG